MATNKYGQTYSGNDDFRGYLAGNSGVRYTVTPYKNVSFTYGDLLNFVGNDGGIDTASAIRNGYNPTQISNAVRSIYNGWQNGRTAQQNPSTNAYISGSNSNSSSGSGSYTSSSSSSAYDAAAAAQKAREELARQTQINYYNNAISQANNTLNGLSGQLANLNAATNSSYNTQLNELQSGYNTQQSNYKNSSRQNMQNLQSERNTVADQASRGLRGLQRLLGAMGAGGSSEALYVAPEAVTSAANRQLAGVNQTFGQNQQTIDTNWNNYLGEYENDKKKLADWKEGQLRQNEQNIIDQQRNLLANIASLYAGRGALGVSDDGKQDSLTSQINSLTNRYNELSKFVAPTYTGSTAVYEAPPISSYFQNSGDSQIETTVDDVAAGGTSQKSPLLAMLMGLSKKKEIE